MKYLDQEPYCRHLRSNYHHHCCPLLLCKDYMSVLSLDRSLLLLVSMDGSNVEGNTSHDHLTLTL